MPSTLETTRSNREGRGVCQGEESELGPKTSSFRRGERSPQKADIGESASPKGGITKAQGYIGDGGQAYY